MVCLLSDVNHGGSAAVDTAQAFWSLLLSHGLRGGALAHIRSRDEDGDDDMQNEEGWKEEYTQMWFEFLGVKGGKGVSKDTWSMVCARCRGLRLHSCLSLINRNRVFGASLQFLE